VLLIIGKYIICLILLGEEGNCGGGSNK